MKAKEFIYSRSQELAEAIDNGYDLRLSEPDILYWMEKYAEYKAKNLPIHNVSKRLEIDFDGSLKAEIILNNTDKEVLKVLRVVNGYGQVISPEYVTITDTVS